MLLLLGVGLTACGDEQITDPDLLLNIGTWGGDDVAILVDDRAAHVHVGCTNGNFPAPITLDEDGRFNVGGSYVLRAHPVQVGPPLPAQLAGLVSGGSVTFTVAVNDTVEKKLVLLGPVTVQFRREPRMGPCPVCAPRLLAGNIVFTHRHRDSENGLRHFFTRKH